MYTYDRMPATIDGIETLNFNSYWQAIKDRIAELRELPTWATNHAMKLGITVSNLEKKGDRRAIDAMKLEIDKVNDDIAKAWKVKGYIDTYLPQWMAVANQANGSGAPIVPTTKAPTTPQVYKEPTVTGWIQSWFTGVNGVSGNHGLGIAPLIAISAAGIAALAYVVTVGMSLWQDYRFKKDLTQTVIEGKVTSGQMAEILTAARPPESIVEKIASQAGGNLATIAVLGALGYAAFWYLTAKKAVS